ncbi:GNAT family N-acetyltransferase [Maribellus sp. YY47]|uniref:GNAT family N-acetyltransferase n=1 Tax=Maribellus sp. YY47 TaxID=2929486 RepID=UPI002000FD74|nr:GNAT family N-acetyltransferase [Maribellus sp. YY47]MCK3686415.1 GNAT family N-acetyltransferase [Maribellus sp. YY47]
MQLIQVDLHNKAHSKAVISLLNDYMLDEMGIGEMMPEGLGLKLIEGLKKHTAYIGFLAEIDGEYAALANCNLNFSTWKAEPLINIHDFIVSPAFRKKGVGLFLLKAIESYAVENGYCRINLEVRHDNLKAQALYKKAGFKECDPPNYFWENRIVK